MSSQEIPITISPQQAAHGVILTVPVGTGTARLRIPSSVRDGDLVRARLGDDEVLVRVTVAGAAGPAQPAPAPASPPRAQGSAQPASASAPTVGWAAQPAPAPGARKGVGGRLAALGVLAAVVVGIIALNSGDDSGTTASDVPTATPSTTHGGGAGPGSSSSAPAPEPSASPEETPSPEDTPTPEDTETESVASPPAPEPSPFDKGTCLNGTLPDSTTPQSVTGVDEVPCSASDAHYRVIESFPFTSDLDRCNDNPKTEYAFSYRYTRGATVINEYVYCLVGIGSYGR
ncbi:hypothetical protein AB0D94_10795 [Streptomyces sp. NPDC048255]|uniref:LppU/SCO3897 family protein n=1 Tax=Streptomyces sp. NPDC048255 TaxID=3154713 RepID=UPI0033BFFB7F